MHAELRDHISLKIVCLEILIFSISSRVDWEWSRITVAELKTLPHLKELLSLFAHHCGLLCSSVESFLICIYQSISAAHFCLKCRFVMCKTNLTCPAAASMKHVTHFFLHHGVAFALLSCFVFSQHGCIAILLFHNSRYLLFSCVPSIRSSSHKQNTGYEHPVYRMTSLLWVLNPSISLEETVDLWKFWFLNIYVIK